MKLTRTALAAALLCAPAISQAAEVTGGEISLGYSAMTEDSDFNTTSLEGALELGFTQTIAAQLDLGYHKYGLVDDHATNVTLHGIYHFSDTTSTGLFYGRESVDGSDADFYGIEAGHEYEDFDVEGYVGYGKESGISATVVGLSGAYAFNDSVSLGMSFDNVDFQGGLSARRFGVKGSYDFGTGAAAYAEVGEARLDVGGLSISDTFVGIGATFAFGADRGATFGKRGLAHLVPGL